MINRYDIDVNADEYVYGYKLIENNTGEVVKYEDYDAMKKERQWISVEDRLPEAYGECLLWPHPDPDYNIMSASFRPSDGAWVYDKYTGCDFEDCEAHPSHWMPLPAGPDGEEG